MMTAAAPIMQAVSETGTATWAVLMVVVSVVVAAGIQLWRMYHAKLGELENEVDDARKDASTARHNEIVTLIQGVSASVGTVDRHVEKLEVKFEEHQKETDEKFNGVHRRMGHLEQGHAEIHARLGIDGGEGKR